MKYLLLRNIINIFNNKYYCIYTELKISDIPKENIDPFLYVDNLKEV